MRKSASEILRNLENRIARLEKQSADWDKPENFNSPQQQSLRDIANGQIKLHIHVPDNWDYSGIYFRLETDRRTGKVLWQTDIHDPDDWDQDLEISVTYIADKELFELRKPKGNLIGYIFMSGPFNQRKFLTVSKEILGTLF